MFRSCIARLTILIVGGRGETYAVISPWSLVNSSGQSFQFQFIVSGGRGNHSQLVPANAPIKQPNHWLFNSVAWGRSAPRHSGRMPGSGPEAWERCCLRE